jgi:hypothetical protein
MRYSSAELTFLVPQDDKRKLLKIKTNKIRNIRAICGKNSPLCLADEGSNSLRFALDKKNRHGIYGCHGLSRIKSVKSVLSVVKKHPIVLLTKEATHYGNNE